MIDAVVETVGALFVAVSLFAFVSVSIGYWKERTK